MRSQRVIEVTLLLWSPVSAFLPSPSSIKGSVRQESSTKPVAERSSFFVSKNDPTKGALNSVVDATRTLGSQELLMAPRQYKLSDDTFPAMIHVSSTLLSATPNVNILKKAITSVMEAHPLLQATIVGDGEPDERIDLFQMVRKGDPNPMRFSVTPSLDADSVLSVVETDNLEESWKTAFAQELDDGSWCDVTTGPLWKVDLHKGPDGKCALLFCFNHAISDQSSANRMADQILRKVAAIEKGRSLSLEAQEMPVALEDSVLGLEQRFSDVTTEGVSLDTVQYVAGKAAEGFKSPVILTDASAAKDSSPLGSLSIISGQTAGGSDSEARQSVVQFRTVNADTTSALLSKCRSEGLTISNALTAAVTLTATDFIDGGEFVGESRNYKVLQSLDMRRFGQQVDKGETVACMAGSMDLMHGPLPDRSGEQTRYKQDSGVFWKLAREGQQQTQKFIESGGPQQAVRVFDAAMTISDLNNLVHLTAQSKDTKGRAYSAGITNVGVYERQKAFGKDSGSLELKHGKYQVEGVFFATSHLNSGCLFQVSCMTVGGKLELTFHPVSPIVSEEMNNKFADAFVELLEMTAGTKSSSTLVEGVQGESPLPKNILTIAAAAIGSAAVLSHAGAWGQFFQSVAEMKSQVADPTDFWAAMNFWIFFAVGHPILQPILFLSDVLHGSPGPMVGGLVPISFLALNAVVIFAASKYEDFRNALNVAALTAFFAYIGAGLDGNAGLGDFNLALDDSYKGQVVKGCPAYEEVRQPSMDGFDINKYQGMWYEQKFHDWTQFKEVYDTSLGIKLTEGGRGWVDDFGVKGPAPDSAKLSWDKSPVANGAHYFLFGRVDPNDPTGILREKGFGVEFPNYIVDVQKDPQTGEYTESIQFQCLERGGVRVFEGINFMSRNKIMTDDELAAMHARAEKAGMYPYGASPEQMHQVYQRPLNSAPIDNNWQAMWRAIGLDKLLELLTESIEDGGRQ